VHTDELEMTSTRPILGDLIECDGLVAPHSRSRSCARSFAVTAITCAPTRADLDRGDADPAGRAGYQDSFAGIQMSLGHERVVGGCEGFGNPPADPN